MTQPSQYILKIPSGLRLFLASLLTLFLELALIRWTSAHVLYLGYFSNLALIGCFLGFGLGLFVAGRSFPFVRLSAYALLLLVGVALLLKVEVLIAGGSEIHFTSSTGAVGLPIWSILLPLFVLLVLVFIGPAQETGRLFAQRRPLEAYLLNIGGNLAGIALFFLLSWFSTGAALWFALGALLFLSVLRDGRRTLAEILALFSAVGVISASDFDAQWSPYYRIQVHQVERENPAAPPFYWLKVNNITHQAISDLREREPFYEFPYQVLLRELPSPPDVLVIGSGVGTDLSFGLAYAHHIDAVEIDPAIPELGRRLHPNRPYQDSRVELTVGDGRTFLENTDRKYDLVLFGLPDSLSLVSSYSSVRLESFLFTEEAFASARRCLKENGLFVAYNYFRQEWLVERVSQTMEAAFGEAPVVLVHPEANMTAVFFAGPLAGKVPMSLGRELGFERKQYASAPAADLLASDDWPFLYLKERSIPEHYLWVLLAVGLFAILSFWLLSLGAGGTAPARMFLRNLHLFFTGAAFMLLETASVVRSYALLGSTWTSNAFIFAAVLALVLAATWLCLKRPPKTPYLVALLLVASLAAAWAVPLQALTAMGPWRLPLAALLMLSPIFFANLLFARFFQETGSSGSHLGLAVNVVGAIVGGLAEYSSMLLGYRALYLVAGLLYFAAVAAWFIRERAGSRQSVTGRPAAAA